MGLQKGRDAWCPSCRQCLDQEEVSCHCPEALEELRIQMERYTTPPPPTQSWLGQKMENFRMRRAAQRAHLKVCPRCRSQIEKNRGCNHMTCRCGHEFDWTR